MRHMHVGDVPHRIFSVGRNEDLTQIVGIWEDGGTIIGWALVQPKHPGLDVQIDPDVRRRRPELEGKMIGWAETSDIGLTSATVMYEESNPASGPLYRGMGFVPAFVLRDYRKPFSLES